MGRAMTYYLEQREIYEKPSHGFNLHGSYKKKSISAIIEFSKILEK